jgi:hypothetical protein
MKSVTLTVRVPQRIAADIARESRERKVSKSDVVRERLEERKERSKTRGMLALVQDLITESDEMPTDVSARINYYLKKTGYGKAKRADCGKARC